MLSKPQRQRDGKILRDMEYEYGHLKMSSWSSERNTHTHTHTHTHREEAYLKRKCHFPKFQRETNHQNNEAKQVRNTVFFFFKATLASCKTPSIRGVVEWEHLKALILEEKTGTNAEPVYTYSSSCCCSVARSCPIDYSLPGSCAHEISQARLVGHFLLQGIFPTQG